MTTLTVGRRFRGPTASANGGYICGLMAALAARPVTVRLMRPPPLDAELDLVARDAGRLELRHGDAVVAEARPGDPGDLEPRPVPTRAEADAAAARFAGFERHPAPECFVCGPQRELGDALRIFCGALGSSDAAAGPWTPDASLDAGDGCVGAEIVWAALDCPGYAAAAPDMRPMLLGELTARVARRVAIGEPCTLVGWRIGSSGRKHEAGTVLYGAAGDVCGLARAVWIEPREAVTRAPL